MNYAYRKKPVVIEAFQMTEERRYDNRDWPEWLNRAWNGRRGEPGTLQPVFACPRSDGTLEPELEIVTLEGHHRVSWGDWIIRGVAGELYPCKPYVFAATYEEAHPDTSTGLTPEDLAEMHDRAAYWNPPARDQCIGEDHMARDVLELLDEVARLRKVLEEALSEREEPA